MWVLCPSRICCIDPFTSPKGAKHLSDSLFHVFLGNSIPEFNSSASVKHLFLQLPTQSELNFIFSGYINSVPFGQKIIQILSLSWSKAEEDPVIGMHIFTYLIS